MLLEHGCNLNAADDSGRTALHRSYWPVNVPGLKALLSCGADVDAEDRSGRSVVSYFLEIRSSRIPRLELYRLFRRHLEVRRLAGLGLSPTNEALYESLLEQDDFPDQEDHEDNVEVACATELQRMRDLRFGGYTSLYAMFRDTNKMAAHLARNGALSRFMRSSKLGELFPECGCLIMMQYGKALRRMDLMLPAVQMLSRVMLEGVGVLCWDPKLSEEIVEYLSDEDLLNLGGI